MAIEIKNRQINVKIALEKESTIKLPQSAVKILDLLQDTEKPVDSAFIQSSVSFSMKTTRKSLKRLIELGLVVKRFSLVDARKAYYCIVNDN
ncbi:MAG: hypothetical protein ACTSP4_05865 [Candidatus Hodarchaeales archaeon]